MMKFFSFARSPKALVLFLAMDLFSGAVIIVLTPYVWIREVTSPGMQCEGMDWLEG